MSIKAILTDIEGTTTDINFVHKTLFPYAAKYLPDYVREHAEDDAVQAILADARTELSDPEAELETLISAFLNWIEQDKKVTALKALQGLIWVEGYQQGDFTGHLYHDAMTYLQSWHEQGLPLYVFSSGSVKAQKLLFGYSDAGDITGLFSGYFDTTTGHKREQASYETIAGVMGLDAAEVLFLSDVSEELDAARAAGMQTVLLARDEEPEMCSHTMVTSFDEIEL
ncbi:acireductone synthase [Pontibacterium sp. N1Y112]|uniref:Enolase-phosphatase E1 n=1 Tax=Pontibacterium sinense TaxID=2781979 RepID=A0A8J7FUV3_9GAMM|nr:acireductone synthase [Pontibacterium sinense]MBE9397755.1 acireductone synthase [Pontibacterium sinense]